jgi:hypothetical protein
MNLVEITIVNGDRTISITIDKKNEIFTATGEIFFTAENFKRDFCTFCNEWETYCECGTHYKPMSELNSFIDECVAQL